MIYIIILSLLGLSGGLAVGSGLVAFITVLGIIPRLVQITRTENQLIYYEFAVVFGALFGSWISLEDPSFSFAKVIVIIIGLASGIFVGLLAAALTEVLNVFPILAKRIGLQEKTHWLIWAIVLGKIIGSLYQWLFFIKL